jgi:hypothetical protein
VDASRVPISGHGRPEIRLQFFYIRSLENGPETAKSCGQPIWHGPCPSAPRARTRAHSWPAGSPHEAPIGPNSAPWTDQTRTKLGPNSAPWTDQTRTKLGPNSDHDERSGEPRTHTARTPHANMLRMPLRGPGGLDGPTWTHHGPTGPTGPPGRPTVDEPNTTEKATRRPTGGPEAPSGTRGPWRT